MKPLIIIGAARSGTNMLRDLLTSMPGLTTWPCDEINYIWRHGNVRYPTDEFPPELARPTVRSYIHGTFEDLQERNPGTRVVEKTCANSLRVEFVHRVFPEARFLGIVRDGRDVSLSAMARWNAPLDPPYILEKARWVPLADLPYYAARYAWNRIYKVLTGGRRLAFWGPHFEGMEEALVERSLLEVCALQWKRCVERSHTALARLPQEQVCRVRYEDFVRDPVSELPRILEFADVTAEPKSVNSLVSGVTDRSVGRWRHELSDQEQEMIIELIGETLGKKGYDT